MMNYYFPLIEFLSNVILVFYCLNDKLKYFFSCNDEFLLYPTNSIDVLLMYNHNWFQETKYSHLMQVFDELNYVQFAGSVFNDRIVKLI